MPSNTLTVRNIWSHEWVWNRVCSPLPLEGVSSCVYTPAGNLQTQTLLKPYYTKAPLLIHEKRSVYFVVLSEHSKPNMAENKNKYALKIPLNICYLVTEVSQNFDFTCKKLLLQSLCQIYSRNCRLYCRKIKRWKNTKTNMERRKSLSLHQGKCFSPFHSSFSS